jgi:hypothetical protein
MMGYFEQGRQAAFLAIFLAIFLAVFLAVFVSRREGLPLRSDVPHGLKIDFSASALPWVYAAANVAARMADGGDVRG